MDLLTRRGFLAEASRMAAVAAPAAMTAEEHAGANAGEQHAVLFDSTRCIGCRSCELACNEANELGRTTEEIFAGAGAEDASALAANTFTYVTRHEVAGQAVFGKVQCMHCLEPACASSCPVGALEKTAEGPVVWHGDLCLGCRYCMVACPFLVPRFEWNSLNPRIRKCEMCATRQAEGERPACVAACPTGALQSGTRDELLQEARRRIREQPRQYVHHIYGEREAGGTNLLHLAGQPFDLLGYRTDLSDRSYRSYTRPAMRTIPYVVNGLGLALGVVAWVSHRRQVQDGADEHAAEGRSET